MHTKSYISSAMLVYQWESMLVGESFITAHLGQSVVPGDAHPSML